jgi:hypothetical protein
MVSLIGAKHPSSFNALHVFTVSKTPTAAQLIYKCRVLWNPTVYYYVHKSPLRALLRVKGILRSSHIYILCDIICGKCLLKFIEESFLSGSSCFT